MADTRKKKTNEVVPQIIQIIHAASKLNYFCKDMKVWILIQKAEGESKQYFLAYLPCYFCKLLLRQFQFGIMEVQVVHPVHRNQVYMYMRNLEPDNCYSDPSAGYGFFDAYCNFF